MAVNSESLADKVVARLENWAESNPAIRALWLVGSYATGTADRFSDIDLRGCLVSEDFDFFSSVEQALRPLGDQKKLKRRPFSPEREDAEMVICFPGCIDLDFHVSTLERLTPGYVGPYAIRILTDKDGLIAQMHEKATEEHKDQPPADILLRMRWALQAWDFLHHALIASVRGNAGYALSLLDATRQSFAHLLNGKMGPVPASSISTLPKHFYAENDKNLIESTIPLCVAESLLPWIRDTAIALKGPSEELEEEDAFGRIRHLRGVVETLIDREIEKSADEKSDFWNRFWSNSEQTFFWKQASPQIQELIKSQSPVDRPCVLDLGCGLGRHAIAFAQAGFQVTAVDLSDKAIESLNELSQKNDLNIRTKVAQFTANDAFSEESFDIIVSVSVIYHGLRAQFERAVRNALAWLKPKGLFYFTCPTSRNDQYGQGKEIEPATFEFEPGHIHFFPEEDDLRNILSGSQIISLNTHEHEWYDNGVCRFSSHWQVLVEKR